MADEKIVRSEQDEAQEKLRSAQEAARRPGAGAREKADLKLAEQELAAAKMRERHPPSTGKPATKDAKLDEALKQSFPGSDPVSLAEAGPPKGDDKTGPDAPASQKRRLGP